MVAPLAPSESTLKSQFLTAERLSQIHSSVNSIPSFFSNKHMRRQFPIEGVSTSMTVVRKKLQF
jgi:hypothetical protein